ncbi:DUF924 family protein [Rhodoferax sp.]|uniref:DUF924 family protein n=1 Tax=Rhodoferax sp. TaxID=50421 RepID=UPI002628CE49|nr:DUF924 family protein [Rhodoferax sp.]MDD2924430.1 DUF924 domain-containing protein [Rhodoferax sp.]
MRKQLFILRRRILRAFEAKKGAGFEFSATPEGQLAEIIVLAQELVASGQDRSLPVEQRVFAYMPYMHSESALVHVQAAVLFSQPGMEGNLDYELRHQAIINRFGRYPHRNAILGRTSTAEELAFLSEPGSSF